MAIPAMEMCVNDTLHIEGCTGDELNDLNALVGQYSDQCDDSASRTFFATCKTLFKMSFYNNI